MDVISDSEVWVLAATRRRTRPTWICSTTKTGSSASAISVSCQDSSSMPTSDATTVTTLDRIEEAVSVTTACTPPTSLPSRDWMSPVRVPVKKPRCMDCRCAKSRLRRSCMTRLPSDVVRYVWPTPISAATSGTTIIAATST